MQFSKLIYYVIGLMFLFGCASKPPTFVENKDEIGLWKSISLHNNYGLFRDRNQEIWRRVIDILSEKYDLEVMDRASGYIRTAWQNRLTDEDVGKNYRSRVIVKMLGNFWHTAKLKTETQWREDDDEAWVTGYDKVFLEEIYKDMQGRIGTSIY